MQSLKIAGVLLAAGMGQRFGADKRLYRLPNGDPLVVAAARHLRAGVDLAVAVIRPRDEALSRYLHDIDIQAVTCERATEGMGVSLVCGVAATRHAAGWLIALGDMPCIRASTVRRVARRIAEGASIVVPAYHGRRGHPVGFAARHRPELLALEGDAGARTLLQAYAEQLVSVPVDDPGILVDVDTPDDLAAHDLV